MATVAKNATVQTEGKNKGQYPKAPPQGRRKEHGKDSKNNNVTANDKTLC
jgi:hypothetical protein